VIRGISVVASASPVDAAASADRRSNWGAAGTMGNITVGSSPAAPGSPVGATPGTGGCVRASGCVAALPALTGSGLFEKTG
jgi:hypothetical protein